MHCIVTWIMKEESEEKEITGIRAFIVHFPIQLYNATFNTGMTRSTIIIKVMSREPNSISAYPQPQTTLNQTASANLITEVIHRQPP